MGRDPWACPFSSINGQGQACKSLAHLTPWLFGPILVVHVLNLVRAETAYGPGKNIILKKELEP